MARYSKTVKTEKLITALLRGDELDEALRVAIARRLFDYKGALADLVAYTQMKVALQDYNYGEPIELQRAERALKDSLQGVDEGLIKVMMSKRWKIGVDV